MGKQNPIELTSTNFNQTINESDKPVLVDFWAPWCGPCQTLGPIMQELAMENPDKITVGKLNVDNFPEIAGQFSIKGIPTVKAFIAGKEVFSVSGAYPKEYWEKVIKEL